MNPQFKLERLQLVSLYCTAVTKDSETLLVNGLLCVSVERALNCEAFETLWL
ncbi:hypothetical protein PO909_006415 [Leuciscus waleckii]